MKEDIKENREDERQRPSWACGFAVLAVVFGSVVDPACFRPEAKEHKKPAPFVPSSFEPKPEAVTAKPATVLETIEEAYIYDVDFREFIPKRLYIEDTEKPRRLVDHALPEANQKEYSEDKKLSVPVPPPIDLEP